MHKFKKLFPQSLKNLYHLAQAIAANVVYGFPSRKINPLTKNVWLRLLKNIGSIFYSDFGVGVKVIGVTGTDGKTTTVQMIVKILEEAGKKVAMASTINFIINGKEEKNLSHYTTESAFAVQKFIRRAIESGCEYVVLETSSHALDQHRVWGVQYKTAVITNVTREHLDYHKTMEKYRDAKKILFENVSKSKGTTIVNLDMEKPEDFLQFEAGRKYGYTTNGLKFKVESLKKNADFEIIKAENIELGIDSSTYQIQNTKYQIHLPGKFNIENALAATAVGLGEGIEPETIKDALAKIKGVAGRLERVGNEIGAHIFVDFALTPNALERLYSALFQTKKPDAKIIAVFGSCGDRDKGKRPIMGEVVSKYADFVILTNDEPYHEKPEQIIEEIALGIKNKIENQNFWKIIDRREAIKKALELSSAEDIIAVTGMGNFESMVVGDKKIPWNDRNVIEEELKKLSSSLSFQEK